MAFPNRAVCQQRLQLIFPETMPQRGRLTNQLAGSAIFVFLYADAVEARARVRPSMVLWMCDLAAARIARDDRRQWYEAALRGKRALASLLATWGITHDPWYADNTREPLRDETFRAWTAFGALIRDETVPTTSARPQWSLSADFAALFDADISDAEARERIDDWRDDHLGTIGRARIALARQLEGLGEQVLVTLPGGLVRTLAPGGSSLIVKGVVEELAPRLLEQPAVLFISESRRHVDVVDADLLGRLGIAMDTARVLPDALLFDGARGVFWFVEAVFTDGAIDEPRRSNLLGWAEAQRIPADRCRFISAFVSRTSPAFRRAVAALAWETEAWFLDEPDSLVALRSLSE